MVPSDCFEESLGRVHNEIVWTGAGIAEDGSARASALPLPLASFSTTDATTGGTACGRDRASVAGATASSGFDSIASSFICLNLDSRFCLTIPPGPATPPGGTGFFIGFSTTASLIGRTNGSSGFFGSD